MWSDIRRRELAGAVHRGGAPYFRVIATPIDRNPIHIHGPHLGTHEDDHFDRGLRTYGPLGYTLLRGQRVMLPEQWRRASDLHDQYERLIREMAAARVEGLADPTLAYVDGSRLVFWETLGLLLAVSEQLAVLISGINDWEGRRRDLGQAILDGEAQPHRVFANSSFASEEWWRKHLHLRRSYRKVPGLSSRQRELLRTLSEESLRWTMQGVGNLRNTWNEDLHRVAVRYKHSFTLLSASHGVVWSNGEQTAKGDLIGEISTTGGLLVADTSTRGGAPVQLAVEVTIGGMEVLLTTVVEAISLTEALVQALLQRAEHATGLVMPYHAITANPGTGDEIHELYAIFAGVSRDQWQHYLDDELLKIRHHQAIRDAAIARRASSAEGPSPESTDTIDGQAEGGPRVQP